MGKNNKEKEKENIKEKENNNDYDTIRPGSKANPRQIHIKNRSNFQVNNNYNKNLKRNNKSKMKYEVALLTSYHKNIINHLMKRRILIDSKN